MGRPRGRAPWRRRGVPRAVRRWRWRWRPWRRRRRRHNARRGELPSGGRPRRTEIPARRGASGEAAGAREWERGWDPAGCATFCPRTQARGALPEAPGRLPRGVEDAEELWAEGRKGLPRLPEEPRAARCAAVREGRRRRWGWLAARGPPGGGWGRSQRSLQPEPGLLLPAVAAPGASTARWGSWSRAAGATLAQTFCPSGPGRRWRSSLRAAASAVPRQAQGLRSPPPPGAEPPRGTLILSA